MAASVRSLALILLLTAFGAAGQAHAEIAPPPPQTQEQNKPPRAAMLDQLFSQLAKSGNAEEGKKYETAIEQLWLQSGSPSIDILMQRGLDAFNEKNYDRAFYYFNEVVVLDPAYSEGWHKRATVYYVQDNFSRALADLEHVLRIEPRQFLAKFFVGRWKLIPGSTAQRKAKSHSPLMLKAEVSSDHVASCGARCPACLFADLFSRVFHFH